MEIGAATLRPVSLFYSYSHRDEEFRSALETHLSVLRRSRLIAEWHDRMIGAGGDGPSGGVDRRRQAALDAGRFPPEDGASGDRGFEDLVTQPRRCRARANRWTRRRTPRRTTGD